MHPKILLARALALLVVFAAGGCASNYAVKVDAVRRADPTGQKYSSYRIHPKNAALDPESLRYKDAAQHVKTALSANGLFEAPTPASADLIVEIDYGVEAPRERVEEVEVPVLNAASDPGVLQPAPMRNADGSYRADMPNGELACDGGETMLETRRVTVCEKYISVDGRENRAAAEGQPPAELWRVHVSIEDESRDLRAYLPMLLSVAMDEIGKDTDGGQVVTLSEKDEAIQFIKRGM
ncbi:MAG TPA: hypothetical protein VHD62_14305 [Opitutaceae bacterium]|nr:hypothetical protein [Opitutaceae bacterium]